VPNTTVAKTLKILSINFPFKTPWVEQEPTLATQRALFDFDVVVIRPYLLVGEKSGGPWEIDQGPFNRAKREMTAKIEDINRLLRQDGLLVVILDALQELTFKTGRYTGGTLYTVTNYHFIEERFFLCICNGTGTNVQISNAAEPFSGVIKKSDVRWTAFIGATPPYPFSGIEFFAQNGASSGIGARLSPDTGNLVFLPNFTRLDEEQFFEACREYRYQREGTPAPEWCKNVFLPGVSEANGKITEIDERLLEVEESKRKAIRERDDLLAFQKLLYEKGKTQLEPIVRKALDQIGFASTPGEIIPGPNFEIDGRTTVGSSPGILEIKGSKKQISLDEYSKLIPKLLSDLENKGYPSKGILVGNGLCETQPQDRLGEKVFAPHVVDSAKTQSIALVNSVELYCVVCGVLSGQIQDLERIREKILNTSGFVSLLEYCDRSIPFTNP
jgi:hypothetical protein